MQFDMKDDRVSRYDGGPEAMRNISTQVLGESITRIEAKVLRKSLKALPKGAREEWTLEQVARASGMKFREGWDLMKLDKKLINGLVTIACKQPGGCALELHVDAGDHWHRHKIFVRGQKREARAKLYVFGTGIAAGIWAAW